MSWKENIQNYKLVPITTGDGTTYEVKMIFKGGGINPLTASYNYPGKIGTKPKRNSCASPVYDLFFAIDQDVFVDFKNSASSFDNEWLVEHPLYGNLNGHPTDIKWNNDKVGTVYFQVQFQQSVDETIPVILKDYKAEVDTLNETIQTTSIEEIGEIEFTPQDITVMSGLVDDLEEVYQSVINNDYVNKLYDIRAIIEAEEFDSYRFMDLMSDLLNISSNLISNPLAGFGDAVRASVKERKRIVKSQHDIITQIIPESLNIAKLKEKLGIVNLTALTATITTPSESVSKLSGFDVTDETTVQQGESDYKYKKDVTAVIEDVNTIYSEYVNSVDGISVDGFLPDEETYQNATNVILLAIQEVKDLSVKAKIANFYTTKSDTTPELLAYELYGSATDENVQNIINDNDLFGRETLANSWRNMVIRKNTQIIYYV